MKHKVFYVINILTNQLVGQPDNFTDEEGAHWMKNYLASLRNSMPSSHITMSKARVPDSGDSPSFDDTSFDFDPDSPLWSPPDDGEIH